MRAGIGLAGPQAICILDDLVDKKKLDLGISLVV